MEFLDGLTLAVSLKDDTNNEMDINIYRFTRVDCL